MPLTDFLEEVCLLTLACEADGLGDSRGTYERGRLFRAGFVQVRSAESAMAQRRGVKGRWRLTTLASDPALRAGDVVLRLRDGLRYRIVGQTEQSPEKAGIACRCVEAEVIV